MTAKLTRFPKIYRIRSAFPVQLFLGKKTESKVDFVKLDFWKIHI